MKSAFFAGHLITLRFGFEVLTKGAIHSTKISGLSFENFLGANGSRRVRKVSFNSILKKGFALIYGGCWSLLLELELNDKFDLINDLLRTVSCVEILLGLFLVDPDMCRFSSKIFKHHFRITKRIFETLSGNGPFLKSLNIRCVTQPCKCCWWTRFFQTFPFGPSRSIQF